MSKPSRTLDASKILFNSEVCRVGELNYVSRFQQNFGFEDGVFEFLLGQKDLWADKLFYVPERQIREWIEEGKHKSRFVPEMSAILHFVDYILNSETAEDFNQRFAWNSQIDLTITKSGHSYSKALNKGENIPLKLDFGREGIALNVGGRVTALKWTHSSVKPYLAVFVINSDTDLESTISHLELGMFQNKTGSEHQIKSAIQLYEYDPDTSSLHLYKVLDTSQFGATSDLKWLPADFGQEILGVLSAVFTDGSLHFFKVKKNSTAGATYEKVLEPSYTISCVDEKFDSDHDITPITSFDYLDCKSVIIGTLDGTIAEYIVPGTTDHDDLAHIPSFKQVISESTIKSVTVGRIGGDRIILCHSMGNQSYAIHYENMRLGRVTSDYTNSTVKPMFHESLRSFLYPDCAESLSLFFARHPQLKGSLILKTELISSFHTSEYLNHPFVILGNILGQVFVVNVSRKIFALPKSQQKFVNPLKIWSLYKLPDSDALTLNGDYELVLSDRKTIMYTFTPPEVVISAASWNECLDGSSSYAFGTYTGLLVVERLDPEV